MSIVKITEDNFQEEVLNHKGKVLLDFWASWCGPCMMLSPIVDEVAKERSDIKVGKVNVDEQMSLAEKFRTTSIPTLILFENGNEVDRLVGAVPKQNIINFIDR